MFLAGRVQNSRLHSLPHSLFCLELGLRVLGQAVVKAQDQKNCRQSIMACKHQRHDICVGDSLYYTPDQTETHNRKSKSNVVPCQFTSFIRGGKIVGVNVGLHEARRIDRIWNTSLGVFFCFIPARCSDIKCHSVIKFLRALIVRKGAPAIL